MPYSAKRTIANTFFLRFLSLSVINTSFSYIVKYSYVQQFCIFATTKHIFKYILIILYSVVIIKFCNLARDIYMIVGIAMETLV